MIRIRQLKCLVDDVNIKKSICKKLKINEDEIISFEILKESIDARKKEEIYYVYEVDALLKNEKKIKFNNDVFNSVPRIYKINKRENISIKNKIVVTGTGPCGLFCALTLLEMGYPVLVLERGEKVEDRIKSVNEFFKSGILNENSNVQFGEGGAGTFSDGKLNTLVKDENNRGYFVLKTFYECGANKEIMYSSTPHIGTDTLRKVIINLRKKIELLGGEIRYNSCLSDIEIENNKIKSITINNNEKISTDFLVLAIGHSSRDTIKMLYNKGIYMEPKPFAVGVRCIHNQSMINESQYGKKYMDILPNANYKLACQIDGRGVYSFCMCPGGYVINSSSENNHLVVNGMSNEKRDSEFANSAIVVSVSPLDYGNNLFDGLEFQKQLERKAYEIGNGTIPIQLLGDFCNNTISNDFRNVKPVFLSDYRFSNLNDIYPEYISNAIKKAFVEFGKRIKGFDNFDTVLAGVESRTSSSIRIVRNDKFESNIGGIYPSGEGAGYAGGITSAAIDGIKTAEMIDKVINEKNN